MFGLIFLSKQIPIVAQLNQIPRVNINTMNVFRSSVRLSPILNLFLVLIFHIQFCSFALGAQFRCLNSNKSSQTLKAFFKLNQS